MTRRFFIDTDTASDDAVALMMAFADPGIEVVGVSLVAGNVPLDLGLQNAGFTARLMGQAPPFYCGAPRPLVRPLETAQYIHGKDGMGDIGLPLTGTRASGVHAVDALIEASFAYPDLELVTLGPLTNIALALSKDPGLASRIRHGFIMGGLSDYIGNVVPFAEFNIWVDPEAADIVFGSGMAITMIGWDISRKFAFINPAEASRLRALGGERAEFAMDIQVCLQAFITDIVGETGFDLPDPIAMAVALDPNIIEDSIQAAVFAASGVDPQRGVTFIDPKGRWGREAMTRVCTRVSPAAFTRRLEQTLS